jgi:hypothetical protein
MSVNISQTATVISIMLNELVVGKGMTLLAMEAKIDERTGYGI